MREHIISEIRRLAAQSGGQPPGVQAFVSATGIIESKWLGKYWARWSDALIEAGFEPNSWAGKSDTSVILTGLIAACRHYGRFPTNAEMSMLRATDATIPSPKTILSNFGGRSELIAALREHIGRDPRYDDVEAMLPTMKQSMPVQLKGPKPVDGHVYLIKSGEFYKIGRSDELERRVKEIRIALPDAATLLHSITTDDPPGIEAYWHRRFADRRANGEWFKLTADDIKAFMRRKFQ
ncbi:GIY-YIG nuclease family protein [Rhizobium multihospitium]|uniref:T5orf172 domain-containing protein n=1 Tax=Rhizobium multihospitium TaxID=410764 RepID=A0A1C3WLD2_9HYPH|nr:GIY-YIG nuclease family protein [Rhizobium multihospitium]SCB40779.1 T5orf172 domain-containing protein [Rhizobium multihospitium]